VEFTDLETILLVAVAVLYWRIWLLTQDVERAVDKYDELNKWVLRLARKQATLTLSSDTKVLFSLVKPKE